MMNYKNMYHIDDIVLSQYCPNTYKANKQDKYEAFASMLNSFHTNSNIYEKSATSYVAYIINSILLNALELNKNILSYEHYFFNVLTGFSESTKYKITTNTIAKMWTSLITVYDTLLNLTGNALVKNVFTFQRYHSSTKFIGCDKVNNNYYWDIPIQIMDVEDNLNNILILPVLSDSNIYSNAVVLNTINSFPSSKITIIKVYIDSFKVEIQTLHLNSTIIKFAREYISKNYVNFSHANLSNCTSCPLSPCTTEQMFKVVEPTLKQTIKKIKVLNS